MDKVQLMHSQLPRTIKYYRRDDGSDCKDDDNHIPNLCSKFAQYTGQIGFNYKIK